MEKDIQKSSVAISSAVQQIKSAILQSQARAVQMINQEQLSLYYGIGRYVSQHSRKGYWGTSAIGRISKQLQAELPGLKGFSEENIKLMRRFYEAWKDIEVKSVVQPTENTNFNTQESSANSVVKTTELQTVDSEAETIRQLQLTNDTDFPITAFLNISFTHHVTIFRYAKDYDERKFYIQLAAYLRILDDDERLSFENPSVGIILCKKADKAYVDYVLQDYLKPMGVATYKHMQNRLKELLPPEEEMKRLMSELKSDE